MSLLNSSVLQLEQSRLDPNALLRIDPEREIARIVDDMRVAVRGRFRKRGAVVGISGGIDSSVTLALCVRAFGAANVLGVMLPERESSPDSQDLAQELADYFGVQAIVESISGALAGADCYGRRDEAIRSLFPQYGAGWTAKITLPGNLLDQPAYNVFRLTVNSPEGETLSQRLPPQALSQIIAASNFKQRLRMSMLYYHAERLNAAVIGTPNKNEHEMGFFVKFGDGAYDYTPIRHLFKTQVYALAKALEVPQSIQARIPTTDTYSAGSTQEEFFFRLPFSVLDAIWCAYERGYAHEAIAASLALSPTQVERVVADIVQKKRTTEYLRTAPLGWPEGC